MIPAIRAFFQMVIPFSVAHVKSPVAAEQFFNNQSNNDLILLGAYAGMASLVIVYDPWIREEKLTGEFAEFNTGTPTSTKLILCSAVAITGGTSIYSVVDTVGAAHRTNQGKLSLAPDL
jgi:hypothetical protein